MADAVAVTSLVAAGVNGLAAQQLPGARLADAQVPAAAVAAVQRLADYFHSSAPRRQT